MKRTVSLILATVMLASLLLTGCTAHSELLMSMGQWLGMVNSAFGMETYCSKEAYFSNVPAGSDFFETVQIAAEWEVIDPAGEIDPNRKITWRNVLLTLVHAGSFMNLEEDEDAKIRFAIAQFDPEIRTYWMNRNISTEDAVSLLITAQEQWANRTYDEAVERVVYRDDVAVIEMAEPAQVTGNTVILPAQAVEKLASGEVFVLSDQGNDGDLAYRAEEIVIEDGKAIITVSDDFEYEEIAQEIEIHATTHVDLTKADIYDGNGNLISSGASSLSAGEYDGAYVTNLMNSGRESEVHQLGSKHKISFEVNGYEIEGTISSNSFECEVKFPIEGEEGMKAKLGFGVSGISVTQDIDQNMFGGIESVAERVNYTTTISGGIEVEENIVDKTYAPKWSNGNGKFLTNLSKSVWKDNSAAGAKTIKIADIRIAGGGPASISIGVYFKIKVDGSVQIVLTETGSCGVEYKNGNLRVIHDMSRSTDFESKAKVETTLSLVPKVNLFGQAIIGVKAEGGIGASATLTAHLVDMEMHLLQSAKLSGTNPQSCIGTNVQGLTTDAQEIRLLAESQGGSYLVMPGTMVPLRIANCVEVQVYLIFRVGLESECLVGKLLKGSKAKVTWELLGSHNSDLLKIHADNGNFIDAVIRAWNGDSSCTLEFKPFDDQPEEPTETTTPTEETVPEDGEIPFGELLMVEQMKIILEPGQSSRVAVTLLPKGYQKSDLIYTSSDSSIVSIDADGTVHALKEGSVMVVVATQDGKYSSGCAVSVLDVVEESFSGLDLHLPVDEKEAVAA